MRWMALIVGLIMACAASGQREGRREISTQASGMRAARELPGDLAALEKSHLAYRAAAEKLLGSHAALSRQVELVAKLAQSSGIANLLTESRKMQEMNMSFNLQYLQLQQKMQDESRRFTLLSHIMKTKHDTVKNSISNIR